MRLGTWVPLVLAVALAFTSGCSSSELAVLPTDHDFGLIFAGGAPSSAVPFVVTNGGGAASGALTVALAGRDAADFVVTSDTCTGSPLAPQATCTVSIRFAPATSGSKLATLTIDGSSGGRSITTLSGTGQPPATLALTGAANFPDALLGST